MHWVCIVSVRIAVGRSSRIFSSGRSVAGPHTKRHQQTGRRVRFRRVCQVRNDDVIANYGTMLVRILHSCRYQLVYIRYFYKHLPLFGSSIL